MKIVLPANYIIERSFKLAHSRDFRSRMGFKIVLGFSNKLIL